MWSNSDSRYVVYPPRETTWHCWTYSSIQQWVSGLPSPSTVALGVIRDDCLRIGVIAQVSNGLIDILTTFEALALSRDSIVLTAESRDRLWDAIAEKFAP